MNTNTTLALLLSLSLGACANDTTEPPLGAGGSCASVGGAGGSGGQLIGEGGMGGSSEGGGPACTCGEIIDGSCQPIEDTCRPSRGPCDAAETCDGTQLECGPDEVLVQGSVPVNEACGWFACDGLSPSCPESCEDASDCLPWPGQENGFCDSTGSCVGPDGSL
jgi:hypothetical protein